MSRALFGSGFAPDAMVRQKQVDLLERILPSVRDVRRSGCPALDLCSVAAGRLDGCIESGLERWDIAAGAAIVEAAGGKVVELQWGGPPGPLVIAANACLVEQIANLLGVDVGGADSAAAPPNERINRSARSRVGW